MKNRNWFLLPLALAGLFVLVVLVLLARSEVPAGADVAYVAGTKLRQAEYPPAPVIDGRFTTPAEYISATSDVNYGAYPGQYGWFYVQNDDTTLYMMNDFYVDNELDLEDYNVFRFDLDNNGTYEIEVDVYPDHIRVVSDSIPLDPAEYASLGITATAGFDTSPEQPAVPHRLYELAIKHRGLGKAINFDPSDPAGPPPPPPPTPTPEPTAEWGDAPDQGPPSSLWTPTFRYPTLKGSNGARHVSIDHEWLGDLSRFRRSGVCAQVPRPLEASTEAGPYDPADPDGRPNLPWDTDDVDLIDGGVVFLGSTVPGSHVVSAYYVQGGIGVVDVLISTDGQGAQRYGYTLPISDSLLFLNAWFDWNHDGDWDNDADEHLLWKTAQPLAPDAGPAFPINARFFAVNPATWSGSCQIYRLSFTVPELAHPWGWWSRFRLDYGENAGHHARANPNLWDVRGEAQFGEVEDYFLWHQPLEYVLLPAYFGLVTPAEGGAPALIRKENASVMAQGYLCIADYDCDGMYDGWEERWSLFGLDPADPSDAGFDPDGDGRSNYEEFRHLTNPYQADEYYLLWLPLVWKHWVAE